MFRRECWESRGLSAVDICQVLGCPPHDFSAAVFRQAWKASISSLHPSTPFSFTHLSRSALMA
uniref:Uncharacterized protein n=1 Tax=Anguilla anguilla TaxID=7936 RepID=A0A0E9WEF8_ANGAN